MSLAIITGSAGLVGSETSRHLAGLGYDVVGIDNDMRATFFGAMASTTWMRKQLEAELGPKYRHFEIDVRDRDGLAHIFRDYGNSASVIVHTAGQPSHDWAARDPVVDFDINATGTLNLLELTRKHSPEAAFVFTSTNKVYGDAPNRLPLVELSTRWEIEDDHPYSAGITETLSIDQSLHSLFGASKASADLLVQEYGRYFGLNTACFRGGTLTGPNHSATELHGFLGYVVRCAMTETPYTVFGYQGKQVRDAIHSADLVRAFAAFAANPRPARVYNIGGGRSSNCSVLEAIDIVEQVVNRRITWEYTDANRIGDHIWWIGSNRTFQADYPEWSITYDVPRIVKEIYEQNGDRWTRTRDSSQP